MHRTFLQFRQPTLLDANIDRARFEHSASTTDEEGGPTYPNLRSFSVPSSQAIPPDPCVYLVIINVYLPKSIDLPHTVLIAAISVRLDQHEKTHTHVKARQPDVFLLLTYFCCCCTLAK